MDDVVVEWFQEMDDGCAHLARVLPSGAPEVTAVLGGGCEVVSTARWGDALLVLRGTGQVDRVVGDAVEPLEGDTGWARQVGQGKRVPSPSAEGSNKTPIASDRVPTRVGSTASPAAATKTVPQAGK